MFCGNIKVQHNIPVSMLLPDRNTVNPCLLHPDQRYRTEDSRIRKMRSPVPPKHTMSLAHMDETIHGILRTQRPAFGKFFPYEPKGRVQQNPQHIILFPENACNIKLPDTVHIIRLSNQFLIHINIGNRIQPVKTKENPLLSKQILIRIKAYLIFIIIFHQREGADFIVLPEWVFHAAVSQ